MMSGYAMLREKASRTRTEGLLAELAKSHLQLEELATTRERNRLARDIHDSLGHYLTVINLLLGKAQAFKDKNPPEADRAIEDARRLTNEALEDVRASVKSLRTSQELFSLQKSLPLLVSNLQSEKMQIELEVSGSEEGFSKQSLIVLYRVIQEGLTNVQRHGGASSIKVKITLKFEADEAQLVLEDDGCGFDLGNLQAGNNHGYGLTGLEERLEMIGGEFWVESQSGKGTRLIARICKNKNSAIVKSWSEPAYR
jgi:signal transduction histidine kinase